MTYHSTIASPSEVERLIFHMRSVGNQADNEWAKEFALSIVRQSRRRNWKPSPKQTAIMNRLVNDLFAQGELELIEGEKKSDPNPH